MNAYSYIRVSSIGQVDGDGPDRQRDAIRAFCAKFAIEHQGEFLEAITGKTEAVDRPKFVELLSSIDRLNGVADALPEIGYNVPLKRLKIDCIIVERMDRLARDLIASELLLRECRERGIQVFAADQGQVVDMACNTGDPTQTLMRQILAAIAQWEKSVLVLKMATAKSRIRKELGKCEGQKQFGEKMGEREVLRQMRELAEVHKLKYSEIAKELTRRGIFKRNGKEWSRNSVYDMLKRRDTVKPIFAVTLERITPETKN